MSSLVDRFIHKYGRLPTERDPDYLEMLRMSKYRILDRPDVNPAKCANCGSTRVDGRKYVDFGLQVDWYGVVFLCSLCLGDIALNAGILKAFEVRILQLEQIIASKESSDVKAEELQATFLSTYEGVKKYFDNLSSSGNGVPSDSDTSTSSDEASPEPRVNKTEQRATKPSASARSKDISSLASLIGPS